MSMNSNQDPLGAIESPAAAVLPKLTRLYSFVKQLEGNFGGEKIDYEDKAELKLKLEILSVSPSIIAVKASRSGT